MHDSTQIISTWLRERGVTDFSFDTSSRHTKLRLVLEGVRHTVFMSKTPSDRRAVYNVIRDIRHEIGLIGIKLRPKSHRARSIRNVAARAARGTALTTVGEQVERADWRDALAMIRDTLSSQETS